MTSVTTAVLESYPGSTEPLSQPAQNRVTPAGRIVASAIRGTWMGNRGRLHEASGDRVIRRRHQNKRWLICVLEFKGRQVPQWHPGRYTPLFFVDEATALAAGHRPCAECRRSSYNDFRIKWAWTNPGRAPYASAIDAQLHAERIPDVEGQRRLTEVPWAFLPEGAFVILGGDQPAVVLEGSLAPYDEQRGCYLPRIERPTSGYARALTPPSTLAVLQRGYPAQIHPTATAQT